MSKVSLILVCHGATMDAWSVMFLPTEGRLTRAGMPKLASSVGSPIPESMRSCGVLNTPALRMTSLRAVTCHL